MSRADIDFKTLVSDYGNVAAEVQACRRSVALFDFSFISRARVTGSKAVSVLNEFQSRNLDDLTVNTICYSLRMDTSDAVISDLTIWRLDEHVFEVMSGRPRDISALCAMAENDLEIEDISDATSIFAVQGPDSIAALRGMINLSQLAELQYYQSGDFEVAGVPCRIGRLGYTGERGFELVVSNGDGPGIWDQLSGNATPAGFSAIDILRIEAGFILFTNECVHGFNANELGLGAFANTYSDPEYRLICFSAQSTQRPILWQRTEPAIKPKAGEIMVTSACYSELAQAVLGLGIVCADTYSSYSLIDPSEQFHSIKQVNRPFYDPQKSKPRGPWVSR